MRLTIFWRVILAQSTLITLILALSLYALTALNWLTGVDTGILQVDSVCIREEKQLLKVFFAEMRNAEKYLLLRDDAFYAALVQGSSDFGSVLEKISALIDTQRERDLAREIKDLHDRYHNELKAAMAGQGSWEQTKNEISDGIVERAGELVRVREQIIAEKTVEARDHAASAARVMGWLTFGGIGGALLLAYFHARGMSRPLNRLAQEMRQVGKGEFTRSLDLGAPQEVHELMRTFNWMTEKLAQLDRLKVDFTAHVSHELRTPLTAIREGTALLLEEVPGPLAAPQREILEVVRSHSERLFQSITSILDLSKMEAEMMEYEYMACDLACLIQNSIDSMDLIARKKRIQLKKVLTDPLPVILLDERRIRQVLDNLLSNALKFTPEGGDVCVSVSRSLGRAGLETQLEVRVSDTGEGIPQEEIEKIFQRFYQRLHSRRMGRQGTGLGLAIARHIIEAHNGRIWAESVVGRGSTFIFALPVVQRDGWGQAGAGVHHRDAER